MRLFKRKGSPHWWVQWYDQNGQRDRKSTETDDKKLAEALAAKWRQEQFMEQHFGVIPDAPFQDACFRYAEEKKRQNLAGYAVGLRYQLQRLLNWFAGRVLAEIDARVLQAYADQRRRTIKEATLHWELAVVQAIMNKARREGYLASVLVLPKVKPPKGRCRWLTMEEERQLIDASPNHLRLLVMFALDTGWRRSELLKLDWRNVDLERGRIVFVQNKNGEDRAIRLTDRARAILALLGPQQSSPVFTFRGNAMQTVTTLFERARAKAGLCDARFHDLRHTFASRLVQKGVPLYEVMQLTGHKSLIMVQRYAHLAPEFQERAICALNAYGHDLGTVANVGGEMKAGPKRRNHQVSLGVSMVEPDGIEPTTSKMPLLQRSI
jgi:integrase